MIKEQTRNKTLYKINLTLLFIYCIFPNDDSILALSTDYPDVLCSRVMKIKHGRPGVLPCARCWVLKEMIHHTLLIIIIIIGQMAVFYVAAYLNEGDGDGL